MRVALLMLLVGCIGLFASHAARKQEAQHKHTDAELFALAAPGLAPLAPPTETRDDGPVLEDFLPPEDRELVAVPVRAYGIFVCGDLRVAIIVWNNGISREYAPRELGQAAQFFSRIPKEGRFLYNLKTKNGCPISN